MLLFPSKTSIFPSQPKSVMICKVLYSLLRPPLWLHLLSAYSVPATLCLPPQGLCICSSLCLQDSPPKYLCGLLLQVFRVFNLFVSLLLSQRRLHGGRRGRRMGKIRNTGRKEWSLQKLIGKPGAIAGSMANKETFLTCERVMRVEVEPFSKGFEC